METFQNTHGGKKNGCWSFSFTFWWLALFTTFQKGCVVSVLFFYQCHLSFSCDSKHWKRVMEVFNLLKITKLLKKVYIPSGDCTPFIFFFLNLCCPKYYICPVFLIDLFYLAPVPRPAPMAFATVLCSWIMHICIQFLILSWFLDCVFLFINHWSKQFASEFFLPLFIPATNWPVLGAL